MDKRSGDMPVQAKEKRGKLEHWQLIAIYLCIYDILAVNLSYLGVLWLRFDCKFTTIPTIYLVAWAKFVPLYSVICLVVFWCLHLYRSIWEFASYNELMRVGIASIITAVAHAVGITLLFNWMPMAYYILGALVQAVLVLFVRFSYRFILLERGRRTRNEAEVRASRVMLIGAGAAGRMILRDLEHSKTDRVCCLIDDNPNKWNRYVDGVLVVGGRDDILANAEKYKIEKIYMAIPSASAEQKRDILNICKETGCELKNMPGVYQFVLGQISVNSLQDVAVEDLLGREPIQVNMDEIFRYIEGKTILVTGGGGSIGSELCRQIAGHNPKRLIIFDIYENNAYDIQLELRKKYPQLQLETLIGSVRDTRRINQIFELYKPDIVYHAAAHKHVPLMEDSPCESIKNNVFGTYKTAYAAMTHGCKRFVLISTDKAVNPTNVMGASKRLCEMVIQTFDKMVKEGTPEKLPVFYTHKDEEYAGVAYNASVPMPIQTEFVAVRFGNVLGSNGSVIPLFKKQIAAGGPVTVTHPDIIRYFMTIPEAVSLVLQAGTYAHGGEIFVLDMGDPVKIDTLARNLIKLSGYKPDVDIKIEYTGLRPGEKLYEEKLMAEEGLKITPNKLIHVGCPIPFDTEQFLEQLEILMDKSYNNCDDIREYVQEVCTTYHPAD
jgi:FlaA1/EpsC-like NDP-sugar epimerase